MKKTVSKPHQTHDQKDFAKTRRAYLLTLSDSRAPEGERFVLLQASQSNEVHRFPDLASAFAYLEAQD